MLAEAAVPTACFVAATVEQLPFRSGVFDVATIASALHWLRPEALPEIRRVLRRRAVFVVYDVWFPGEIAGAPEFAEWLSAACAPRYPSPPKNHGNLGGLEASGFELVGNADLRSSVSMTLSHLADYLMTHSERIAAVDSGQETEGEQRSFLLDGIAPIFAGRTEVDVVFATWMKTYRAT